MKEEEEDRRFRVFTGHTDTYSNNFFLKIFKNEVNWHRYITTNARYHRQKDMFKPPHKGIINQLELVFAVDDNSYFITK